MKTILRQEVLVGALRRVKAMATTGEYHGSGLTPYMQNCSWFVEQYNCVVIFTRDVGNHSIGWFKNPDYERCYHLSISFRGGRDKSGLKKIMDGLFGEHQKWIRTEPPHSEFGKSREVWHYRLYCDEHWQPILPRGEAYSTEHTEKDWKSRSEVLGEHAESMTPDPNS